VAILLTCYGPQENPATLWVLTEILDIVYYYLKLQKRTTFQLESAMIIRWNGKRGDLF